MKADIIILALIAAYCAFVIFRRFLRKSKDGGSRCGCSCAGCGHACASRYSYENLFKEKKD